MPHFRFTCTYTHARNKHSLLSGQFPSLWIEREREKANLSGESRAGETGKKPPLLRRRAHPFEEAQKKGERSRDRQGVSFDSFSKHNIGQDTAIKTTRRLFVCISWTKISFASTSVSPTFLSNFDSKWEGSVTLLFLILFEYWTEIPGSENNSLFCNYFFGKGKYWLRFLVACMIGGRARVTQFLWGNNRGRMA